jgi:hypothetical protein
MENNKMRKYILAALVVCFASPAVAKDWEISRTYRSSNEYLRAIITTKRPVLIQCASMDVNDKPIAVNRPYLVEPPMDDVIVRGGTNTNGIKCWEKQR